MQATQCRIIKCFSNDYRTFHIIFNGFPECTFWRLSNRLFILCQQRSVCITSTPMKSIGQSSENIVSKLTLAWNKRLIPFRFNLVFILNLECTQLYTRNNCKKVFQGASCIIGTATYTKARHGKNENTNLQPSTKFARQTVRTSEISFHRINRIPFQTYNLDFLQSQLNSVIALLQVHRQVPFAHERYPWQ